MGEGGRLPEGMGQLAQEVRRAEEDQVEVAVARLQLCESPSWGKKTGPNPTDRGKLGTKRYILTDQRGTPISGPRRGHVLAQPSCVLSKLGQT